MTGSIFGSNNNFRLPQVFGSKDIVVQNDSMLFDAIVAGNTFQVEKLVSKKPSLVNQPLCDGELPLHAAVRLEHAGIIRYLMNQGCDASIQDSQGMSALDYAVLKQDPEILRLLLPAKLVQNMDKAKQQLNSFDFADAREVAAVRQEILVSQQKAKKYTLETTANPATREVVWSIFCVNEEQAKQTIAKASDFNQCDSQGISPMHAAAATGRANLLQQMAARGGDLFAKNSKGVAPADLLLSAASEKDPARFEKTKLLLTFLQVGSLIADRYLSASLSPEASKLWYASMFLMNLGAEAALTYQAYLRVNSTSAISEAIFWASFVSSIPMQYGLLKIPGARVIWDLWRTQSVCQTAFAKIAQMYRNYTYDSTRSVGHIVHGVVDAGATLYQVRGSLDEARKFIFTDVAKREQEFAERLKILGEQAQVKINQLKSQEARANCKEECERLCAENAQIKKLHDEHRKTELCQIVYHNDLVAKKHEFKTKLQACKDDLAAQKAACSEASKNAALELVKKVEEVKIESANQIKKMNREKLEAKEEFERTCNEVKKIYFKLMSEKSLPFLVDDQLSTGSFSDAVCMLYGHEDHGDGYSKQKAFPMEESLRSEALANTTASLQAMYNKEDCEKARIETLCTKAKENARRAADTIRQTYASAIEKDEQITHKFVCKPNPDALLKQPSLIKKIFGF